MHLTTVHPWSDTRIFRKMCFSLAREGNDVHLLAAHGPPIGDRRIDGVRVHLFPEPTSRWGRLTTSAWQVWRRALSLNGDVYHFHDPELIGVGLLLRLRGRIVVYDVHEDMPKRILDREWVPRILRKPMSWLISAAQSIGGLGLSGVVSATPSIARRFNPAKTVTVRNFPSLDEFSMSGVARAASSATIVFIGTIDVTRGVLELVEAFRQLCKRMDARLVIAGRRRDDEYNTKLTAAAGGLPVEFPGFINRDEVQALLAEAAVGVVISLPNDVANEAISTKLFEYMAGGIPVVTTNMPLWAEIVETTKCGSTVDPTDATQVADALEYWLVNADAARQAGENGRTAILETYSWEREFPTLMRFYEQLCDDETNRQTTV